VNELALEFYSPPMPSPQIPNLTQQELQCIVSKLKSWLSNQERDMIAEINNPHRVYVPELYAAVYAVDLDMCKTIVKKLRIAYAYDQ